MTPGHVRPNLLYVFLCRPLLSRVPVRPKLSSDSLQLGAGSTGYFLTSLCGSVALPDKKIGWFRTPSFFSLFFDCVSQEMKAAGMDLLKKKPKRAAVVVVPEPTARGKPSAGAPWAKAIVHAALDRSLGVHAMAPQATPEGLLPKQ